MRCFLLAMLAIAMLGPYPARATTWYFSATGNDANDGLTENAPKRDLNLVPALLTPGSSVLLKRGDTWYADPLSWDLSHKAGTREAPILLGAYGNGPRPIVANLDTATWTKGAGGLFHADSPNRRGAADTLDQVVRLYLSGAPLPRASGPDAMGDSSYSVSPGGITVRCDACDARTRFEWSRAGSGSITAGGTSDLTIADLELKGGTGWAAMLFTAPSRNVTLRDLYVHQFNDYGIEFTTAPGFETTPDAHENVAILDCTIDKGWSARMNHERSYKVWSARGRPPTTLGANDAAPGGDGINLNDAIDGAVVRGCFVTNMGHSGIQNEQHNPRNFGTRHILVERNEVTAGTSSYCRAVALGGDSLCRDNVVRRNWFHDVNICAQFGGESTYVYSNIFERTNDTPVRRAPWAISSYINPDGTAAFVAHELVIANNTIVGAEAGLIITSRPQDAGLVRNNRFFNNLVVDWRTTKCWWKSNAELNTAMVEDSTPGEIANWSFLHNAFWKSARDSIVLTVTRVSSIDRYGVAALNARRDCAGNRFGDPLFEGGAGAARFTLSPRSPWRSNGVPLERLLPAGMDAVDYFGRPFGASPAVGAIGVTAAP